MHIFRNLHPSFTFGFYSGEITETESFSFIANLKIEFFYSTSGKFTKNNHPSCCVYSTVYLCVVGVMFANSFVSLLVGGYVCYWVCLFVGWGVMFAIGFISRDGVSVGLFHYRIKAIPWILNYKWADYWPY